MAEAIRIVFHAPTAAALARARRSVVDVREAHPAAETLIVVDAEGAEAALVRHDEATDAQIVICEATLRRNGLEAPPGSRTTPLVTLFLVERQAAGWTYVRA